MPPKIVSSMSFTSPLKAHFNFHNWRDKPFTTNVRNEIFEKRSNIGHVGRHYVTVHAWDLCTEAKQHGHLVPCMCARRCRTASKTTERVIPQSARLSPAPKCLANLVRAKLNVMLDSGLDRDQ